ncbi:MAG TPA: PHB depolymerase family esterase [Rhodanobacteraceae bacterium]|nr:PHB depolymerase family esterase [Rhodanobacteraceae bacterium]
MIRTAAIAVGLAAFAVSAADSGLMKNIVFDHYSALSGSAEIARRLFTPLSYQRMQSHLADVRAQPVDLAQEKFAVYVPSGAPPENGYGVFVFIPPWPEAALPDDWPRVLERHGIIFVSAANSGNDAGTLDRRVPLALLAYENIRSRYRLDADRVYVGGLSGGSRVALRVALAYPDVFDGALLNAGSDPVGGDQVALPPNDLFERFQQSTRIAFVTGERDEFNRHADAVSQASFRSWCVFNLDSVTMPRRGHEIANASGFAEALKYLEMPRPGGTQKLKGCRARLQHELASKIADAQAAIDSGSRNNAIEAVNTIDAHFGGTAADAIQQLQGKIDARK